MKVYLDVVFFLNFMFDFLLLLTVSIEQKTYPKKRRIFLGALFGSLSTFLLFLPLTNTLLLFFKLLVGFIMLLIAFGKRRILSYGKSLFGNSILLGGFLSFLDLQLRYHPDGFLIFQDKSSISLLLILLSSPPLFYFYQKGRSKQLKELKLHHQVVIYYKKKKIVVDGFLDTGNTIKDPYKKRDVLILSHKDFSPSIEESILVPFQTIGHKGLIRCVMASKIIIDEKEIPKEKVLIGKCNQELKLYGSCCILPEGIVKEEEN